MIIPVFNKLALTQKMFASLVKTLPQSLAVELIVVDDASTDDTQAWLASLSNIDLECPAIKAVHILKNTQNLGLKSLGN